MPQQLDMLVIEKNVSLRDFLCYYLQQDFFAVGLGTSVAAWNYLKEKPTPDLIILGELENMEQQHSLLKFFKQSFLFGDIPVFFLCSNHALIPDEYHFEEGVFYFKKPIDPELLVSKIIQILSQGQAVNPDL